MAPRKRATTRRNKTRGAAAGGDGNRRPSRAITLESPIPSLLATQMGSDRAPLPGDGSAGGAALDRVLTATAALAHGLLQRSRVAVEAGDIIGAVELALQAVHEADSAPAPGIPEVMGPAAPLLEWIWKAHLGSLDRIPRPALSKGAVSKHHLNHRRGFLLSCIDGVSTIEQLLDISGMPAAETLSSLVELLRDGLVTLD